MIGIAGTPVGFGVVGAGTIGRVHVRNISARGDSKLCWVIDVDRARAAALGEPHGARIATTLDDMLADPAVHVVVIASSTDAHEANMLAAVRARKAILCEKPIGDSLDGARRCVDAAHEAGTIAAIGFNRRFDVTHRAVHDRIRAGDIGRVESVHIVSRSFEATPPAAAHRAGGLLREKGTHFYDLACWLAASDPLEVYAAGDCLFDRGYADYGDVDTAALTLRLASGALATFSFSRRTAYGYDETIEVFGAGGMLQSERLRPRGVSLYQGPKVTADGIDANWYDRFAPTYAAELDALIAAVRTKSQANPSLADGLRAQAVAEAAIESLAQRAPVAVRDVWN